VYDGYEGKLTKDEKPDMRTKIAKDYVKNKL